MNKFIKDICLRIYKNCDVFDFKNKTVLITGANGLIGGFLADFLHYLNVEYDYNIKIILTSLSANPKRLKHLLSEDNVMYFSTDLTLTGVAQHLDIDYCFYCAGYAQPGKFLSNPYKTFTLNVNGLRYTLKNIFYIFVVRNNY